MGLQNRIEKLEQEREEGVGDDYLWRQKWNEAYRDIAETMDAHDFAGVHAEIVAFLNSGASYWSSGSVLSFVAARVLSLVHRAADGRKVGLMMPPALFAAWRDHDQRLIDASPDERHKGSFDSHECVACGAEHPWLGRYEPCLAERRLVLVNPDDLIKTCVVCGGEVGRKYGNGFVTAASYARALRKGGSNWG